MSGNSESSLPNVINLGNSIIGVSILAMPYCFQKCGIFLSIFLIVMSGFLTKATCHLLLKSAIMERRRNFEFLAFHTFGTVGKFAVEFGIIGFLLGSCIAFFVVIGDLSPPLVSEFFLLENTPHLRLEMMLFIGFFIALPLGLLRRVESLTSFSTFSVGFYIFLVFKILNEAWPNFSYDKFVSEMNWWQPAGLLSSLPIFAMALSCQTQLFEIFDTLNEPSLKRMDTVVSNAVNMCSSVYILVGLFGYIAFYDGTISGNILVKLESTFLTKLVKLAFVSTVIVSFPLCLFPCRTSLHSLIYKSGVHDMTGDKMAANRFRLLTFLLVAMTIGTAIMLPNIEFVLGILGSTIGTTVCFILPTLIFIRNTTKDTNERLLAKFVLSVGVFILVACSYSTLQESARKMEPTNVRILVTTAPENNLSLKDKIINEPLLKENIVAPIVSNKNLKDLKQDSIAKNEISVSRPPPLEMHPEKRQEPPIPQEPEDPIPKDKPPSIVKKPKTIELKVEASPEPPKKVVATPKTVEVKLNVESKDALDPEALKKEDKEMGTGLNKKLSEDREKDEVSKKQDELLKKIEMQQLEQKKMLEEQRKILEELKEHKETHLKDEPKDKEFNRPVKDAPPVKQESKVVAERKIREPNRAKIAEQKSANTPEQAIIESENQVDNNLGADQKDPNNQAVHSDLDAKLPEGGANPVEHKTRDSLPKSNNENQPPTNIKIPQFLPQVKSDYNVVSNDEPKQAESSKHVLENGIASKNGYIRSAQQNTPRRSEAHIEPESKNYVGEYIPDTVDQVKDVKKLNHRPVEAKRAQVKVNQAHVEAKQAPIENKPSPIKVDRTPVEAKRAPVEVDRAPVETKRPPIEVDRAPVETKRPPVEVDRAPVETKRPPMEVNHAPVKEKQVPAKVNHAPIVADHIQELPIRDVGKTFNTANDFSAKEIRKLLQDDDNFAQPISS